jgi:hypothetical protein
MIFQRSIPTKTYADYTLYRPLLRRDFQYRCAYCLRHEYFLGGEAGCCIDHRQPVKGPYARPDLIAAYSNLYWCCRECNENKGDTWPSAELTERGFRLLDSCRPEDDCDLHLHVRQDGSMEILTNAGRYTHDTLRLWRANLVHYRAEMLRCQEEVHQIRVLLAQKTVKEDQRELLTALLTELLKWLEPPVFNRPHGAIKIF